MSGGSGEIGTQNISILGLRTKWGNVGYPGGSDPGSENISLSEFRGATFSSGSPVPSGSNPISINDHFKGKTFGSSSEGNVYSTSDFNFNDDFSGEGGITDRLYPVLSPTSSTSTSSSKYARLFNTNVDYSYPCILLCPQSGDPTIETTDDAEVWIKMQLNSPYHYQVGIIHKQGESSWSDLASDANILRYRHTTYKDRIALHTYGYVTHAGHDVESSTKTDELMNTTITNETTTSNYHNRIGTTAGSSDGNTLSSTYYYLQSDVDFYQSKTHTSSDYYIGMKLNYYEITLTGTVSNNSKLITNVKLNNSNLTEDDNVYSGMYLSSTQSDPYFPSEAIIQSVRYNTSNNTEIDMGDEINGSVDKTYGYYGSTITFKAVGQRLEFQYAIHHAGGAAVPKNIGPNHIILPRKYQSGDSNLDIDSWAFFVGDSSSHWVNTATFSIQTSNPSLYPDITSDFLEISNRFISATSWSDYTGAYDVSETEIGLSGSYRLYIGIKITSSVTYYNDICIAGVQVLNSSNSVKETWIFNTTSGDNWETHDEQLSGSSTSGFPITPSTASGKSYTDISTSSGVDKFSYASSTSSYYTGAAGGISGDTGTFTVGNGKISQVGSANYLYREASGSTAYSGVVMQSPAITLASGDKIRVAHLMVGPSNYQMNADDSLYLGAYADNTGS